VPRGPASSLGDGVAYIERIDACGRSDLSGPTIPDASKADVRGAPGDGAREVVFVCMFSRF